MSDFELSVGVIGVDQASQALRSIGTVQQDVTRATAASTTTTAAAAEATRGATQSTAAFGAGLVQGTMRVAGIANAIQSLTSRMGSRDNTAGLIGSVATTTAQFAAMGSSLGPAGAVGGAVVGFIASIHELAQAHTSAAVAARQHAEAEADLARASGAALATQIASGGDLSRASPHDLAVELQARRRAIAEARAQIASDQAALEGGRGILTSLQGGTAVAQADIRRMQETITAAQREVTTIESAMAAGPSSESGLDGIDSGGAGTLFGHGAQFGRGDAATPARRGGARAARGGGGARAAPAAPDTSAVDSAMSAGSATGFADVLHGIADQAHADAVRQTQDFTDLQKHQRDLAQTAQDAAHDFESGYVASIDRVIEAWRRANAAQTQAGGSMISQGRLLERSAVASANNIADAVGNQMTGAFQGAVSAWLDGSKTFVQAAEDMAKGVLRALTSEAIVQVVVELARAATSAASSYGTDPAVEMHLIAAAEWAAVGALAGAAGAAAGAFGGGGGARSGASSTETRNASHESQNQAASQGPVTFNVYPGGFTTKGDVQAGVVDAINQAARRGYQISRNAIERP